MATGTIKKTTEHPEFRTNSRGGVSKSGVLGGNKGASSSHAGVSASETTGTAGAFAGRVAVYARVSSERQEKDETIASQTEAVARYAREHGFEYVEEDVFLDDGYSGQLLRRPGLDKLLDKVYEGYYERVLILSPDRLARSYGHQIMLLEELRRKGCEPVFVNRPIGRGPDEELLLQMQGVIAQYEHSKIIERTRRGKIHRMRRGELVTGRRVFGYNYMKASGGIPARYEIITEEAQVVRDIFRWYAEEGVTLRAIAARLYGQGVATVRGGRWCGSSVGNMLGNSIYTGTGHAHKEEAIEPEGDNAKRQYRKDIKSLRRLRPRGEWMAFSAPAIVSEETFELARQRLGNNKELASRHTKRPYLLRGLIKCETCQSHMRCDTQGGNYICPVSRPSHAKERGREPCVNTRRLPVAQLDKLVWDEVKAMLKKPALLKKQYPQLRDKIHPRAAGSLEVLDQKIGELAKQTGRINELFIRGVMTRDDHATRHAALEQRKAILIRQREKVAGEHMENQEAADLLDSFKTFAKTVRDQLENADFETRRNIATQMVKSVSIGEKVITIESIAPLKKYNLCTTGQE